MKISSPITLRPNTKLLKKINKNEIIDRYFKELNIDVSSYFRSIDSIYLFKCLDTGYLFYYPFNIAGDEKLYTDLQNNAWYYSSWKWENEIALHFIDKYDHVLEIGCGNGSFLKNVCELRSCRCMGIDINQSAIKTARKKGLNAFNCTVEDLINNTRVRYDKICSFQVLEHIAGVNSFFDATIGLMKKRGKLIISVPNNNSYLKFSNSILNSPPHHIGLWSMGALKAVEKVFPVKLVKILYEPLQEYHINGYIKSKINRYNGYIYCPEILNKLLFKLSRFLFYNSIKNRKNDIRGHTILAVYEKL